MLKRIFGTIYIKTIGFFQARYAALAAASTFVFLTFINHLSVVTTYVIDLFKQLGISQLSVGLVDDLLVGVIAWFVYMYFAQISPPKPRVSLTPDEVDLAIIDGRMEVVLQPVYRLRTNTVVGFESLVRLHHPIYGVVMPREFMENGVFEDTASARRLTAYVIERTADYYRMFLEDGNDFQMTVNLFSSDLKYDDIQQLILRTVRSVNMPEDRLTVEISEHTLSKDTNEHLKVINSLGNSGLKISLDDYGVQVTSFIRVKEMGAAGIKLDYRLIERLEEADTNRELIQTIIHGAHSLGTSVTAKHVEKQSIVAVLRELDCDYIQGYVIAPPMPFDQAREWIKTRRSTRSVQ